MSSICLQGWYGKGNVGDDALLLSIADVIHELCPSVDLHVVAADAVGVGMVANFSAFSRNPLYGFWGKLDLIRRSSVIVLGGGTGFCDHDGVVANLRAFASGLFWPIVGRVVGTPTIVYAHGFGPANNAMTRCVMRVVALLAKSITFRDRRSATLFSRVTGMDTAQFISCDPVIASDRFSPCNVASDVSAQRARLLEGWGEYIVASVRRPKLRSIESATSYYRDFGRNLADVQRSIGCRVLVMPAHLSVRHEDDLAVSHLMADAIVSFGGTSEMVEVVEWETASDAAAILQNARVVVGDRLHSLLLAAIAGVPVVGVDIEDKIRGCLEMIGLGRVCHICSIASVSTGAIALAVNTAWECSESERAGLKEAVARWARGDDVNRRILETALWP